MKKIKWVSFLLLLIATFSAGVIVAPILSESKHWLTTDLHYPTQWELSLLNPLPYVFALSRSTIIISAKIILALIGWLIWNKTKKLNLVKLSGLVLFIFMVLSLLPAIMAMATIFVALVLMSKIFKRKKILRNTAK